MCIRIKGFLKNVSTLDWLIRGLGEGRKSTPDVVYFSYPGITLAFLYNTN